MRIAIAVIVLWTGYFVLLNRSSLCPVRTALTDSSTVAAQRQFTDSISKKVRAVETEGAYRRWETPEGQMWMPADSDWLVKFLLAEQARGLYGNPVCRPGDVVLDCGAHVGVYTRHAIKNGARLVVAIEPAPENRECLNRNLAQEIASGKVIVVPKGVWDREDRLFLHRTAGNSGGDSITADGRSGDLAAPLTTIDRLVEEFGLPRVDVIKMDIEGAERNALAGARATLSRLRPRLSIATYHRSDDVEVVSGIALRSNPTYSIKCGTCARSASAVSWFSYKRIVPEVLFFQ
ncbi:MAG: FkbM family methyltransferase [Terriglobales bacterium]